MGIEGDRVWTAAAGFGGGIGRQQYVCGAVSGAVIGLGLYGGQTVKDTDPRAVGDAIRSKVVELVTGFEKAFGSVECRGLVPQDFNAEGGYQAFRDSTVKQDRCHGYVKYAVETVARWRDEGQLWSS